MVRNSVSIDISSNISSESLIFVDVLGWGLDKQSAAEIILRQVIQGCADHVDCLALSNIPAQYSASIGHLSSWSKGLSLLLSSAYDPMNTLETMNTVLKAINKRIVIFFEDLDRNWQGDDFWAEIISLLDRLKKLDRVSFVLAITGTDRLSDIINRISEHIEIVPKLSVNCVSQMYATFKHGCIQEHNDILLSDQKFRYNRILASKEDMRDKIREILNQRPIDELETLTAIIENPRNLKHILRRTYRSWQTLHGEIDFDHLFIANVLRIAAPNAFNFIHENIRDIYWLGQKERKEEDEKPRREKLQTKLSNLFTDGPAKHENVEKVISFLFPYWEYRYFSGAETIQGLSDFKYSNYWERIIREKLNEAEISDQEFVRAVHSWKANKDMSVYRAQSLASATIDVPEFPKKLYQFRELLDGNDVHVLLSQVFDVIFHAGGTYTINFPGRDEFKQLMWEKSYIDHRQWLISEVTKLYNFNLSIAVQVFSHFTVIIDNEVGQNICNILIDNAKSVYSNRELFIEAVQSSPTSIRDFVGILNHHYEKYGYVESTNEKWRWLADLLLDCERTHRTVIIQQIVEFTVYNEINQSKLPWLLNTRGIEHFFQDRHRELLVILSKLVLAGC